MPLRAASSTPPGKKSQHHHTSKGQHRKVKPKPFANSPSRNYDEELRQYLAATSQAVPAVGDASADLLVSSLNLPFSKDFGSFDLTICETDDKKFVVLVKYERRVFINGTQVYIRQDGLTCDIHGNHDPVLQRCYDQASKIRRRLRKVSTTSLAMSDVQESDDGDAADKKPSLQIENQRRSKPVVSADEDGDASFDGGLTEEQECQWTLPMRAVNKKSKAFIEADIRELERDFNKIIHALCTMILDAADHEVTDTESAHSDGDYCLDQRQLIQEAIRRFSYQFQSVLELSNNLREEGVVIDDEVEGDDESSDLSSMTSDLYRTTGSTPAWIHDGKSWRNEKARLHAEVAAARSEQQRAQRRQEELRAQVENVTADRDELRGILADYESENRKLKQRASHVEELERKPVDKAIMLHNEKVSRAKVDREISLKSAFGGAPNMAALSKSANDDHKPRSGKLLKSEMKRLRHVADDMEEDLEKIMQENVTLRVRGNQMERDRKDLKEKLRLAQALCEETKSDLACLDKKNAELETRCQNLEREKANSEVEISRTSNLLVELRSRYRALERDAGELDKTVKMLKTEKQQQREELDKLERAKIECNNKAVKMMKDNAELQSTLSQLKRDKANLEVELRLVREEHDANCAVRKQAEEARKMALGELTELRRAHAEMSEQITRLQETASNAELCCQTLKEKNEELVSKTHELEGQNESLETRTRSLSNTGRLLEVENSKLKHMVRRLRFDNVDMKTRIGTLSQANADYRDKVEQWNRENASAEGKMRSLLRAKGYLENIVSQMSLLGSDAKSQFERLDTECAGLREQQQRSKTQLVDGAYTDDDDGGVLSTMTIDLEGVGDRQDDDGGERAVMIFPPVPH